MFLSFPLIRTSHILKGKIFFIFLTNVYVSQNYVFRILIWNGMKFLLYNFFSISYEGEGGYFMRGMVRTGFKKLLTSFLMSSQRVFN